MRLLIALMMLLAQASGPKTVADARHLFEAGKYRETLDALSSAPAEGPDSGPALFLTGQTRQKLNDNAGAQQAYMRLATRADADPWRSIGQSALASMDKRYDEALTAAKQAAMLAPASADAYFQLGIALAQKTDYAAAAQAFDKATQLDNSYAYGFYWSGLSYNRIKRIDLMAARFETFLRLAPNAPERGEVQSIMRTVRGR